MKSFNSNITTELAKEIAATFLMVELQFTSTYRYTDCDVDMYYGGNKYDSFPFTIGNVVNSAGLSVDSLELNFSNVDQSLAAVVLGEDIASRTCILSFFMVNSSYVIIGAEELFRGLVGEWDLSETKLRIKLVNEFILWSKRTLRTCQASCPWVFKDTECGYSGSETWCDQSYDRCSALSNTDSFGGHRFLPFLEEKKIWWGRLRSETYN